MPIKVQNDLPAREILERENIFVMDEDRAMHQDIRPLQVLLLNLMPTKEATELQILRSLSNTPLQVDVTFTTASSHESKNTSILHLNRFYVPFSEIKDMKFDGMIITGAPLEDIEYEEVDFWEEFKEILVWTETHVTSTMFQCWAAQAAIFCRYGIRKKQLSEKKFGIFEHEVKNSRVPLVRGFDDVFYAPHSRHTEVNINDIEACGKVTVLADSRDAGFFLGIADEGRKVFVQGHPEYDRMTLDTEYRRDVNKGLKIDIPVNYYRDDNPDRGPVLTWRSHCFNLYSNWLNYYVYQTTPYNLYGTPEVFK